MRTESTGASAPPSQASAVCDGIVIAATSAGVLILIAESETAPEAVSSISAPMVETNLGNGAVVVETTGSA